MVLSSALLIVLTGWHRALLVGLFAAMHLGMLLTMRIGLFPLVSLAGLLPFVPGGVWDAVERRLAGVSRRLQPYFTAPASLPSPQTTDSWDVNWPTQSRLPGRLPSRHRVFSAVVGLLLVGSLLWNAMSVGLVPTPDRLAEVHDPETHAWDMFARGRRADGWLLAPAELGSGGRVDALRGGPVEWEAPPDLARTFPSARWLRYSLSLQPDGRLAGEFAEYLCWRWHHRHGTELVDVTVVEMERPVRVDGPGSFRRIELAHRRC